MLVGKTITLRPVREKDLPLLYDLAADLRELGEHWPVRIPSEQAWMKRFQEGGWWSPEHGLLLILDQSGTHLGQVNFFKAVAYQNAFELGFRLYKRAYWGRGTMTEAIRMVVAYLFATHTIDRVQATVIPGNQGSERVLEKCGFQFEGVMRKAVFHNGASTDLKLFSVLREECPGWQALIRDALAPLAEPEA